MRRKRRHQPDPAAQQSGADVLLRRARRWRRRGEHRRAMLALQEACAQRQDDAALWTLYAAQCLRAHRREDAERALCQAVWLRHRARDRRRARVTQALLESVRSHGAFSCAA